MGNKNFQLKFQKCKFYDWKQKIWQKWDAEIKLGDKCWR